MRCVFKDRANGLRYLQRTIVQAIVAVAVCLVAPDVARSIVNGRELQATDSIPPVAQLLGQYMRCSAVIVGKHTVLTSAACALQPGIKLWREPTDDAGIPLDCSVNNNFTFQMPDEDLALCDSKDIDLSSYGIAKVADEHMIDTSAAVTLAGFGCYKPGGVDQSAGLLRIGRANIVQEPNQDSNYIVLSGDAFCQGDAGGGVFLQKEDGTFYILGVASRGDAKSVSWASATFTDTFRKWAFSRRYPICGSEATGEDCAKPAETRNRLGRMTFLTETFSEAGAFRADRTFQRLSTEADKCETIRRVCNTKDSALCEVAQDYWARLGQEQPSSSVDSASEVVVPTCGASIRPPVVVFQETAADAATAIRWACRSCMPVADSIERVQRLNPGIGRDPAPKILVPVESGGIEWPTEMIWQHPTAAQAEMAVSSRQLRAAGMDCEGGPPDRYPFSLGELLRTWLKNASQQHAHRSKDPVKIVSADSGIWGAGTLFPKELLVREDDKAIQPSNPGLYLRHGTEVTSLLLGGPVVAPMFGIFGRLKPAILLDIRRVYGDQASLEALPAVSIPELTKLLEDDKIADAIVNLSLDINLDALGEKDKLKFPVPLRDDALFVVAAGNNYTGREGWGNLEIRSQLWPAIKGGESAKNVITVAAVDGKFKLAPLSNWGKYVDIAAGGCRVPVLSWDSDRNKMIEVQRSGTSLSAPLVSFVAALLKSEASLTPKELRERIIVSSDFHDSLTEACKRATPQGCVLDGRVLNPAKAIAIYDDIITATTRGSESTSQEVAVPSAALVVPGDAQASKASKTLTYYGQVGIYQNNQLLDPAATLKNANPARLVLDCETGEKKIAVSALRKIATVRVPEAKKWVVYRTGDPISSDLPIVREVCSIPTNVTFLLDNTRRFEAEDLLDLVPRLRWASDQEDHA